MKKIILVVCTIFFVISMWNAAAATLISMSKEQIKQAFFNKTITSISIDVLNGKPIANTFIAYLDDKGNIVGKLAQKPEKELQMDLGNYKVKENGMVCLIWRHWDHAKELCFNVYETQNAYISVDSSNIFHTVFMKNAIQSGKHL